MEVAKADWLRKLGVTALGPPASTSSTPARTEVEHTTDAEGNDVINIGGHSPADEPDGGMLAPIGSAVHNVATTVAQAVTAPPPHTGHGGGAAQGGKPGEKPKGKPPLLSTGSHGEHGWVAHLQEMLNKVAHAGLKPDGIFRKGTHEAVVKFQTGAGLKADGMVGPLTWAALDKPAAAPAEPAPAPPAPPAAGGTPSPATSDTAPPTKSDTPATPPPPPAETTGSAKFLIDRGTCFYSARADQLVFFIEATGGLRIDSEYLNVDIAAPDGGVSSVRVLVGGPSYVGASDGKTLYETKIDTFGAIYGNGAKPLPVDRFKITAKIDISPGGDGWSGSPKV